MYNEWISGTPISEIVNKTGIKRKTWNKRFERYEKQLEMTTNNSSQITSGDKNENVAIQSGYNGDKCVAMTSYDGATNTQKPKSKLLTALGALTVAFAIFFIYMEIRRRRKKSIDE